MNNHYNTCAPPPPGVAVGEKPGNQDLCFFSLRYQVCKAESVVGANRAGDAICRCEEDGRDGGGGRQMVDGERGVQAE